MYIYRYVYAIFINRLKHCIYIHTHIFIYIHTYIYIDLHIYLYTYTDIYIYIHSIFHHFLKLSQPVPSYFLHPQLSQVGLHHRLALKLLSIVPGDPKAKGVHVTMADDFPCTQRYIVWDNTCLFLMEIGGHEHCFLKPFPQQSHFWKMSGALPL